MLKTPPAKKELRGWHFPATVDRAAEYIEAETIEAAEKLYHQTKRQIGTESAAPSASEGAAPSASAEPAEKELPATNT